MSFTANLGTGTGLQPDRLHLHVAESSVWLYAEPIRTTGQPPRNICLWEVFGTLRACRVLIPTYTARIATDDPFRNAAILD